MMKKLALVFASSILVLNIVSCTGNNTDSSTEEETPVVENTTVESKDYIALGKEIAQGTFKALSGKLKNQIVSGGVENALPFCNANAMPLTDSLSKEYDATIQRVSMNYRNPKNIAIEYDVDVYAEYSEQMSQGNKLKPVLHTNDEGKTVFYAPILLKAQCVVCHGEPITDIGETTLAKINEFYPEDNATGYAEGDLRGLWKITFNN